MNRDCCQLCVQQGVIRFHLKLAGPEYFRSSVPNYLDLCAAWFVYMVLYEDASPLRAEGASTPPHNLHWMVASNDTLVFTEGDKARGIKL